MKKFTIFTVALILASVTSCGGSSKFKVYGAPTSATATSAAVTETQTYYGSPTYLKMKMYAIFVSINPDCTGLVPVADYGADGQEFNIFDLPTLFQGSPADGTYNCMVIKMLDTMYFKPAQSGGTECVAGTEYPFDIARGQGGVWVDTDFNPITTDAGPNTVYLFATTDSTKTAAKGVDQGTIPLTTAMVSPGQTTLVMDFTNRVYVDTYSGIPQCWLDSPTMSFK